MSETVQIVLIISVAVIVVLIIFRERLSRFMLKAGKDGLETELETQKKAQKPTAHRKGDLSITGNKQVGRGNIIDVERSDSNVDNNLQLGDNQRITAHQEKSSRKKKR